MIPFIGTNLKIVQVCVYNPRNLLLRCRDDWFPLSSLHLTLEVVEVQSVDSNSSFGTTVLELNDLGRQRYSPYAGYVQI